MPGRLQPLQRQGLALRNGSPWPGGCQGCLEPGLNPVSGAGAGLGGRLQGGSLGSGSWLPVVPGTVWPGQLEHRAAPTALR